MRPDQPKVSEPMSASEPQIRFQGFAARVSEWNASHPVMGVVLVAVLAVVINCYPILFCGRSYVSPVCVNGALVYNGWPPLPGMKAGPAPNMLQHGSDSAATMWWGVPIGFIEARSVLGEGELPLWNRYSHAGDTLIGQGISMLGDPLQLIVIFGRGSAWAWDLKFLAAKFLFCVGFGLLILRVLGSRPLSLIYTVLAAYSGAWFYIDNHPAFFVFSYAPWILLAAIEWLDLRSGRQIRWGLAWLLANFACFNAGHVELAVVLIGGLNLAAVTWALAQGRQAAHPAGVLVRMGAGTLCFLGLTAPVWMSFLASLEGSFTTHAEVNVVQLPPTALPGAFDDLFYILLRPNDIVDAVAPGTSLLVLAGCSFSVWRWRQLKEDAFFWINTVAIGLWSGCVFGWVPSSLLATVPLLNRVGHVYTDFSYLLVIHLMIQSAYGFKGLAKAENVQQVAGDVVVVVGVFAGMLLLYFCGYTHRPIRWDYLLCAGAGAIGAPVLYVYMKSRRQQMAVLGWAGIVILGFMPNFRFGLYNRGDDTLLMLPGARETLNPPSQAIDKIKMDRSGPFRVVGLQWNFMGDYSAVYELEDIRSCAPVSNKALVDLLGRFPGVELSGYWMVRVSDVVQAQPLLNLLNVKYLLAPAEVNVGGQAGFRLADRSDFGVLENLQAWPRAFFASQVVSLDTNEEFIHHLLKNGREPFIALTREEIESQPGLRALETTNPAVITAAANYRLGPNATGFDIHAPSAGMVCLTEGQGKDFTALANHEPVEVLTVNRAFKGVYLGQPGDYHMEFIYRPRHWRLACAAFGMAAGAVMLWVLTRSLRGRRAAKGPDILMD